MVVVDAVTRYVPGVVGKEESILRDSFSDPAAEMQLVEHPHYTRPAEFRGWKVPDILISGDHRAVRKWRHEAALRKTERNRPDLLGVGRLAVGHQEISSDSSPDGGPDAEELGKLESL